MGWRAAVPVCAAFDALGSEAAIYCLKPRHSALRPLVSRGLVGLGFGDLADQVAPPSWIERRSLRGRAVGQHRGFILGKCHLLLGRVDEAMPLLRKAEAIIPGYWAIHLKLAGALGLKGEIEEASAELRIWLD
jgi:tetratricopeptide repeat protein